MYILPFAHLRHLFSVVMSTSCPQKRDKSAPKLSISIIKLIMITYLIKCIYNSQFSIILSFGGSRKALLPKGQK